MDHQEILPKRKRVDTITQVEDEAQENSQNDGLPSVNYEWEEAQFGIPLQSDDDSEDEDMSDEDYDDFWKDQKVILGGRLAVPTPEQMKHSPALPSGKTLLSLRII